MYFKKGLHKTSPALDKFPIDRMYVHSLRGLRNDFVFGSLNRLETFSAVSGVRSAVSERPEISVPL